MTDKKTIRRAVRAVWDDVKALRSDKGKLYDAANIAAAADALLQHGEKLKALATEMSALSAMPAGEPAAPKPKKLKPKKRADKVEG